MDNLNVLCCTNQFNSTWTRNDVQVKLKKRYNDSYKSSKDLLSGNEWYCHQAFRALNQAAGVMLYFMCLFTCSAGTSVNMFKMICFYPFIFLGRCIRHKFDYGGIILIGMSFVPCVWFSSFHIWLIPLLQCLQYVVIDSYSSCYLYRWALSGRKKYCVYF